MIREIDTRKRAVKILGILKRTYPDVKCALHYNNVLQLLIATILSAQCTDAQVNKVTPALFKKFKTAADFAKANRQTLEAMIRSTGFYKNKATSIQKCCAKLLEDHNGKVPKTMEELTALPGVGRKTANVVLGYYYKIPSIIVDTHMIRISGRLGFTKNTNADKIEFDLQKIFPEKDWIIFSLLIPTHGRNCCYARRPTCDVCAISALCPSKQVNP